MDSYGTLWQADTGYAGLTTLAWSKPAQRSRRNAAPGTARNNSPRAIAGKLHRHLVAGLTDGEDDGDALW